MSLSLKCNFILQYLTVPQITKSKPGKTWLKKFAKADVPAAKLLARSIRVIRQSTVESYFSETLTEICKSAKNGNVAVFSIRELDPKIPDSSVVPTEFVQDGTLFIRSAGRKVFVDSHTFKLHRKGHLDSEPYFGEDKDTPVSYTHLTLPTKA